MDARIDEIVFKTLEKERELRHQSVTEVKTELHRVLAEGEIRKPLAIASPAPQGSGLGKLAFGLFLFGIVVPFLGWMISERAAQPGCVLSALLMIISLVLGLCSWRQTLGKVSVIASSLVLLLYVMFILLMARGTVDKRPETEQESRMLEAQPRQGYDFSTPKNSIESMIEAARERNARVLQNGISRSSKAALKQEGQSLDNFGDFGQSNFVSANKLDATNAEVVVEANDGSQRRCTFWMILEDGEWKLNELGSKPSKE